MKKILVFNWFDGATEFYRLAPLAYLKSKDFEITISREKDISWFVLLGYDAIIIERPSSNETLNIIKLALDMGIKVITDWDDDCLHLDQYNPMYGFYENDKQNVIDAINLSTEVWVSTKGIKKSFSVYNSNINVINNAHDDYMFTVKDKKPFNVDGKLAMWRGGYTHIADMYDIGVPEKIIEIVNGNPDWTFKFIGQRFEYLELRCGDNYISEGGASPIQFYRNLHDYNPNIFFCPLADTVFNRSKSNISWLEATYSGAAFFGQRELPEFDTIGVIDFKYLQEFFSDNSLLEMQNNYSWQHIQENYLLSKINTKREERLLSL